MGALLAPAQYTRWAALDEPTLRLSEGTSLEPFESAANAPSTLASVGSNIAREDGAGATDNRVSSAPDTAAAPALLAKLSCRYDDNCRSQHRHSRRA